MTPHPSPERVKPSDGLVEVVAMTIWNNLRPFHFIPTAVSEMWAKVPDQDYVGGEEDYPEQRRGRDSYRTAAREILGLPALANAETTIAELREALARETEECAKIAVAGSFMELHPFSHNGYGFYKAGVEDARFGIAKAIRSRTAPATAEGPKQ